MYSDRGREVQFVVDWSNNFLDSVGSNKSGAQLPGRLLSHGVWDYVFGTEEDLVSKFKDLFSSFLVGILGLLLLGLEKCILGHSDGTTDGVSYFLCGRNLGPIHGRGSPGVLSIIRKEGGQLGRGGHTVVVGKLHLG